MREWTCADQAMQMEIDNGANSLIILSLLCAHVTVTWCKQRLKVLLILHKDFVFLVF
jgi:hypothetical protein